MKELPEDGNCIDLIKSVNIENEEINYAVNNNEIICQANVFSVCNIDNDAIINKEVQLQYSTTDKTPINEFTSEGYIACAFPTLFPTGNRDYLQPRKISLTRHEYFKFLLQYHDQRFARDPRFRFLAMNTILRNDAISKSSLCMKLLENKKCTIQQLRQMILNDNTILRAGRTEICRLANRFQKSLSYFCIN